MVAVLGGGKAGVGLSLIEEALTFLGSGEGGGGGTWWEDDRGGGGRVEGKGVERFLLGRVGGGGQTYEASDGFCVEFLFGWRMKEGFTFIECIV